MRTTWLAVVALALAGCSEAGDQGGARPGVTGEPPAAPLGDWADLAGGLPYNGTGAAALVAEIHLEAPADCELSVAAEYNATGWGVQFMSQFREEGGGSMTGSHQPQGQAIQVGPVDTRSGGTTGPRWAVFGFGIETSGTLFVGVADAQPIGEEDVVPGGTVYVTSTCPAATARWVTVGVDPVFFTSETVDGALLVSANTTAGGVVVAGARGFDRALGSPRAILVANVLREGAGTLELTSSAGTERWTLGVDSRRIWHEGPGGPQSVAMSQAGGLVVLGALFGAP